MGCASSASVKSNTSHISLGTADPPSTNNVRRNSTRVGPELSTHVPSATPTAPSRNSGIAFEVSIGENKTSTRPPPKRLSRLDPIEGPTLTAEELEEKLRLAERKRNNQLESRAKTALESRKRSKRKRELIIARELERQHEQARELETKLKSAEKHREFQLQQKLERQKLQEERIKRAQLKKEKMLLDEDILSDVEKDENFNNDDVDSWLEGSNNETNTVDTGFSSATSERIYSGESPKKKSYPSSSMSRGYLLDSASTMGSCTYKQSRENLRQNSVIEPRETEDDFYDS